MTATGLMSWAWARDSGITNANTAKQAAKTLLIAAELVADPGLIKDRLELAHVKVALGEDLELVDIDLPLEDKVELLQIRRSVGRAADIEQLHQGDHIAPAIAEGLGDHRPSGAGPQILRRHLPTVGRLLGPGTTHVADGIAIHTTTLRLACRDIKVEPQRRCSQGGMGVQRSGLAGARRPDEQVPAARHGKAVHAAERTPVEGLNETRPETLGRLGAMQKKVWVRWQVVLHASSPSALFAASSPSTSPPSGAP